MSKVPPAPYRTSGFSGAVQTVQPKGTRRRMRALQKPRIRQFPSRSFQAISATFERARIRLSLSYSRCIHKYGSGFVSGWEYEEGVGFVNTKGCAEMLAFFWQTLSFALIAEDSTPPKTWWNKYPTTDGSKKKEIVRWRFYPTHECPPSHLRLFKGILQPTSGTENDWATKPHQVPEHLATAASTICLTTLFKCSC